MDNKQFQFMNEFERLQQILSSKDNAKSKKYILLDENTYNHCLPILIEEVDALSGAEILEVESSESSKCLSIVEELCAALLDSGADKNSILISLGGGIITDLGGFLASVFKRGIKHIAVPTTLLAMIDAAIGGKNGINVAEIKNQVGTITQNYHTCINVDFLDTLEQRHIVNGFAEMIKIALVSDEYFWNQIKGCKPYDGGVMGIDEEFIFKSIQLKQDIVEKDFLDKNVRKILNFGHSLGHAFESIALSSKDVDLLHGEAVAIGIYYAIKLSENKLGFPLDKSKEICDYLKQNYRIISLRDNFDMIINYLQADKKNTDSDYNFVLLEDIGKPHFDVKVSKEDLLEL